VYVHAVHGIIAAELKKEVEEAAAGPSKGAGPQGTAIVQEPAGEPAAVQEQLLQPEAAPEVLQRGSRRRALAASEPAGQLQQQQTRKRTKQATLVAAGKKLKAGTTGKVASPAGRQTRRGLRGMTAIQ
jgi:hypothetical protein